VNILKWILKRTTEPSTMAGITAVTAPLYGALYMGVPWAVAAPAVLTGVAAILMKEKGE